jgi:hypothetical protein
MTAPLAALAAPPGPSEHSAGYDSQCSGALTAPSIADGRETLIHREL